ncbi:3-phosphoshikimate 1-carboxyvinyltransferase [Mariniblastus fucicola]|uniref:3-phosphoshikimate 1-carboxyvinyltransferase n=1 Tax=Mariniblastus fucicola TaxID=980251 RepID=A0A5B9PC45_9BACT|nr:3-phosphoshikimate 1-carboxyvinyltransferase [Mariniblastus fucicola]QEG22492.1 3-phosphoshikimate 1-carboxyvinyltransferase [Mariniblastus fucicola]
MLPTKSIRPVDGPVNGQIRPPGSKSITNRALICAALANGTSTLTGVLDSDDTRVMLDSLTRLGFSFQHDPDAHTVVIEGQGGRIPNSKAELSIGNSGTSVRFLTAMLGLAGGDYRLDGVERMRQRPIGPLVEALQQFGSKVEAISPGGCPPVVIQPCGESAKSISVAGHLSSQYLSGLLMAAPLLKQDLRIQIEGHLVSLPYVAMTTAVMKSFGVKVDIEEQDGIPTAFLIRGESSYSGCDYAIEPDASAASYFFAIPAIIGGETTVLGLGKNSLQGDVGFVQCLEQMGCEIQVQEDSIRVSGKAKHGIDVDMANISDTVQTLTSVALFVDGPTNIRNVAHNRVKETDRIGNLAIELRKLGVTVDEREDGLTIHPAAMNGATFDTYDDHRMAMSFALIGLRQPGINIENPGCVSKTYPEFFEDLERFVAGPETSGV